MQMTIKSVSDAWAKHRERVRRTTVVQGSDTPEIQAARIARAKKDYAFFFEFYLPHYAKSACADFHVEWANAILAQRKIDALLPAYRSSAKSVHCTIGIPLWLMIQGEMNYMALVGENDLKAKKLLSDVQTELQDNQRFAHDYGVQYDGAGTWQSGNFKTKTGISFYCLGIEMSPRGLRNGTERPDYIVVDDCDTSERCRNPRRVRESVEWINGDLKGCFDATDSSRERFVCVNNLIEECSIMGELIKEALVQRKIDKDDDNEISEKVLVQQKKRALQEFIQTDGVTTIHKDDTYICKVNAVDREGNPTWTAKTSKAYWTRKRLKSKYRTWMREYMNRPIKDGTIFKREWLNFGTPPPLSEFDTIVGYGDLSYRVNGDYKAMAVVGRHGHRMWLLAILVRQCTHKEVAKWTYEIDAKLAAAGYEYTNWWIEGNFIQSDFVQNFDDYGASIGRYIPVKPDTGKKGDKYTRIEAGSDYFETGAIWIDIALNETPDYDELETQLFAFEKGGTAHDDGPDALTEAMKKAASRVSRGDFTPQIGTWEAGENAW